MYFNLIRLEERSLSDTHSICLAVHLRARLRLTGFLQLQTRPEKRGKIECGAESEKTFSSLPSLMKVGIGRFASGAVPPTQSMLYLDKQCVSQRSHPWATRCNCYALRVSRTLAAPFRRSHASRVDRKSKGVISCISISLVGPFCIIADSHIECSLVPLALSTSSHSSPVPA